MSTNEHDEKHLAEFANGVRGLKRENDRLHTAIRHEVRRVTFYEGQPWGRAESLKSAY